MKKELSAHQKTISILSQAKEAQFKLYKTRTDKELDKVIALENKVKVSDNIVYKTGQSVQTMNMLNSKCRTSFEKPKFLKKAQRANPLLYDIGVIPTTSVSRPKLKSNPMEDRVLLNNSQGKKQDVEDHHRNVYSPSGNDLLTGSRGTDLYSITLQDTTSHNPIFLMAKATSSLAWLWNRHLSHLNFDTINLLSKNDIVVGLPKLKFVKDHLCSSCELGKAKRNSFQTKTTPSSKRRLQLLHLDLCGPMRVASINEKKYVLACRKRTSYLRILHQTSVARTPEQNGVVKRRNHTLVEAARIMLSAANVPLFIWAEAIATTCFTQNHGENLDKMKEKGNACIFLGYSNKSRAYTVFNKRTRVIVETIHVNFDELPHMTSDHVSSNPVSRCQRTVLEHDSLSPGPQCQENVTQTDGTVTTSNELDLVFSLMFDDLLNGSFQVVSKSFAVTTADAPNQRQQQHTTPLNNQTTPDPTCYVPTHGSAVTSTENINQAEMIVENAQVADDKFINIFCTLDEVYVNQPDAFVDPYHPYKVYHLKKALYGLKQAPRAWYNELSNFLVSKRFSKGIQIHQSPRGIFINQAKYAQEILIKHGMTSCDSVGTPMATKHLDAYLSETLVDQTKYHSMVGALMYLTASRPDIVHATCYCARYQAKPTEKHLTAVKRIFWYLRDTIHMGLWYPKDIGFELTAFSDSDHAVCLDSRKSTSGGIQFLGGDKLVSWSSKKQDCTSMYLAEAEYISLSACFAQVLWMRT
nr:hypothetical protein [Tanacetum cinerariifolium]